MRGLLPEWWAGWDPRLEEVFVDVDDVAVDDDDGDGDVHDIIDDDVHDYDHENENGGPAGIQGWKRYF